MLEQNESNNITEEQNKIDEKAEVTYSQADENSVECECCNQSTKVTFIDTLKATFVDLIIMGGVSTILLYVVDAILKAFGYHVVQKLSVTFIIFMVVYALYNSIMESSKECNTIGKKVAGLAVAKKI